MARETQFQSQECENSFVVFFFFGLKYSQSYGFFCSHVRMCQLSAKKLMPSKCAGEDPWGPLDSKIKPVNPLGKSFRKWTLNIHWKDWCWSWRYNILATWWEEPTHWKRLWCWERLKAGGGGDDRGWDGWMASATQCTWVWANSERWWNREAWRAAVHGVTKSGHNWVTEQQQ